MPLSPVPGCPTSPRPRRPAGDRSTDIEHPTVSPAVELYLPLWVGNQLRDHPLFNTGRRSVPTRRRSLAPNQQSRHGVARPSAQHGGGHRHGGYQRHRAPAVRNRTALPPPSPGVGPATTPTGSRTMSSSSRGRLGTDSRAPAERTAGICIAAICVEYFDRPSKLVRHGSAGRCNRSSRGQMAPLVTNSGWIVDLCRRPPIGLKR